MGESETEFEVDVEIQATPAPREPNAEARRYAESLVGNVLSGRYRIDALLALGGMGAVYRGEHVLLRKQVAIKVLRVDVGGLPDIKERFEREALVGAHVQHPNIVAATDLGRLDDGAYFLVLEYVPGRTLHAVLDEGPLAPLRAAAIARQIAAGLAALHAKGIVHRDLKPLNVMLVPGEVETARVLDFGFARVSPSRLATASSPDGEDVDHITREGAVFGTLGYLAPEAARGMDAVDARSDLYALGVILYVMLTGRHPFDVDDPVRAFEQHRRAPPPPFAIRAPERRIPRVFEAITMRLLEKSPDRRFQTADALIRAIDAATTLTDGPEAEPKSTYVPLNSTRPYFVGVLAAIAIAGAIAAYSLAGDEPTSASPPSQEH